MMPLVENVYISCRVINLVLIHSLKPIGSLAVILCGNLSLYILLSQFRKFVEIIHFMVLDPSYHRNIGVIWRMLKHSSHWQGMKATRFTSWGILK